MRRSKRSSWRCMCEPASIPSRPASTPSSSTRPASCSLRSPGWACSRTRRWSVATLLPTNRACTSTAIIKDRRTYEIMTPESVGAPPSRLVLGRHSGRHAVAARLADLGYPVAGTTLNLVYDRFLRACESGIVTRRRRSHPDRARQPPCRQPALRHCPGASVGGHRAPGDRDRAPDA